jgi:predicted AlkP superfamily phosphohydrolase/phosphomutase
MTPLSKVLFIGIDAGDKDLVLRWADEGVLPTFGRLLAESAWGITKNPPGLFVGAIWPSFSTGTSPARHGRYSPRQIKPGVYASKRFSSAQLQGSLFWEDLSRAGRRSAVIDVPRIRLAKDLNGIQLFNWLSHDPEPEGFTSSPSHLADEVVSRFGANPMERCDGKRSAAGDYLHLRELLRARVRQKARLSRHFLSQGGWDLFLTVFTEAHCMGHQTWHLQDPGHPQYDAALADASGNALREVYREIDSAVGEILGDAGPDTAVFVLASHGMGPHYDGTAVLDKMLVRLEERYDPFMRWRKKADRADADWEERRFEHRLCYKVPNNNAYGSIRINLKGREPRGRVRPGADCRKFCDRLIRDLEAFTRADTRERIIRRVYRIEELYPGEETGHLPDLIVEWNRSAPIERVYSPKTGVVEGFYKGCRTGDHKPDGLFFAKGPGFRAGRLETPVSVMDFAPTISEFLNVPLPAVQGRSFLSQLGSFADAHLPR